MFNIFKEKCPVCSMVLEKGKTYPEARGKRFCSEKCKNEYSNKANQTPPVQSKGGCCH